MNTFFTADLHFGHANIIDYCRRPFRNVDHMNEMLIENYNRVVGVNDKCYILGDVGFMKVDALYALLCRLNGRKVLIAGNHDEKIMENREMFCAVFEEIHEFLQIRVNDVRFVLCHYPLLAWPRGIMLHGHCHGTAKYPTNNYGAKHILDVGVDCHGWRPITADEAQYRATHGRGAVNELPEDEKKYYLRAK